MKQFYKAVLFGVAMMFFSAAYANHNSEEALAARVAAVGTLNVGGAGAMTSASDEPQDPETVYNTTCGVCHNAGVAGAPIMGAADDWTDRLAQGIDTLVDHAIMGYTGSSGVMPPKGGNPALSDDTITATVQFMVDQSQ